LLVITTGIENIAFAENLIPEIIADVSVNDLVAKSSAPRPQK
jgi:hypothetical protein